MIAFINMPHQSLITGRTDVSSLEELRAMLVQSVHDHEIIEAFKLYKWSQESSVFETIHAIADARGAHLARKCIKIAFPQRRTLNDALKRDVIMLELTMVARDSTLLEEEKIAHITSCLDVNDRLEWSIHQTVFIFAVSRLVVWLPSSQKLNECDHIASLETLNMSQFLEICGCIE